MRKLAAVIVIVIIAVASAEWLTSSSTLGYGPDDLNAPEIVLAEGSTINVPSSTPASSTPHGIKLGWTVTKDIYAGSGGALWLKIENSHFGEVYVYGFGLVWDDGTSTRRNCSVHVPAGGASSLGLLIFEAPDSPGNHSYHIVISMASTERSFNPFLGWDVTWGDHGEVSMSDSKSAQVLPLLDTTAPKVTDNVPAYYTRINSLVSYEAAREVADIVRAEWPGEYNILQVVEAFEWVRGTIEYREEEAGLDHWQSAEETLTLKAGDCEDHAILLASTIGALGGNARVNIIQGHAFPTVFVGTTEQQMERVEEAIASYYGLPAEQLTASYLVDDMGYWLVIDTTGFPYAGGIPAQSGRSTDGGWSMNSDYLYAIDATGDVSVDLFRF
jgi:hypothetical protein